MVFGPPHQKAVLTSSQPDRALCATAELGRSHDIRRRPDLRPDLHVSGRPKPKLRADVVQP
eukprot:252695-Prymnesium_polylepis.1